METDLRAASTIVDAQSAVSWGAIAAGAVGAAALALLLIAFGAGLGLSAISPWSDSGVSASTFKTGTGIYLVMRRRDVVGRRWLSRRATADEMGGRSQPRGFLSRHRARLYRLGLRNAIERERFELGDAGISPTALRRAWAVRQRRPAAPSTRRIFTSISCSAPTCRGTPASVAPCRQRKSRRAEARIPSNRGRKSCGCGRRVFRAIKTSAPPTRLTWRKSWPLAPA